MLSSDGLVVIERDLIWLRTVGKVPSIPLRPPAIVLKGVVIAVEATDAGTFVCCASPLSALKPAPRGGAPVGTLKGLALGSTVEREAVDARSDADWPATMPETLRISCWVEGGVAFGMEED